MARRVKTICPYCGVGCGIIAETDGPRITRIRGNPDHPANFGKLCPKGATIGQTVNVPTRLRHAMLRTSGRLDILPAGSAVREAATRLEKILQTHGPGAIAFYLSGQLTTESQYLANKFAKAYLRTNHVDSNSRLCMASAASGMSLSLGSDGPPTCYADIELADTFLFVGSNAADCHPIVFDRAAERIENGATCIAVDPRQTRTTEKANLHLAVKPGTDLVLLNGLLRLLRDAGKINQQFVAAHTQGWPELEAMLEEFPPQRVADECAISVEDLHEAARLLGDARKLITFWTMGVNQSIHGTFTNNAIINLHLALGQIGKPGCGPFSLTGQPNAMGGRDCGYMSHSLPGQRGISDPDHRRQMEQLWGLRPGTICPEAGYDAVRMFDALDRGELKAIWIIGSNPAATMPNLPKIRHALSKAELVIVQDAYYPTETTAFAHLILPAAVNLEQDGTFCNSERRVTLMEQVVEPPGDARPDWWWVKEIAAAMGFTAGLKHNSAAEIFDEFARTTAGRPNDQSALHHELLKVKGPQQWPYPAMGRSAERRYTDASFPTPSGKARFWPRRPLDAGEKTCAEFSLVLTTGRVLNQWHTRTKSGNVTQLNKLDPAPFLQIHPEDARELHIDEGEKVCITSRRGSCFSTAKLDTQTPPGTVFMPMHWNELWATAASPNEAASDETDPISREPALKCCAVNVCPVRAAAIVQAITPTSAS